jgi:hypothetical protein
VHVGCKVQTFLTPVKVKVKVSLALKV